MLEHNISASLDKKTHIFFYDKGETEKHKKYTIMPVRHKKQLMTLLQKD